MASVLIVEDDPIIRDRFVRAVKQHEHLQVCADTAFFKDALSLLIKHHPDVMLVDLGLPDGDGINLICKAKELGHTESIVVTVFGDEHHMMRAIESGATGYLLKNTGTENVGDAIVEMLNGGAPISPAISRYLLQRLHKERKRQDENQGPVPSLTVREMDVLSLISKGLNYEEIAEILHISFHTVSTHIKHVYRKLHVSSRSEAVYEAEQLGLIRIRE